MNASTKASPGASLASRLGSVPPSADSSMLTRRHRVYLSASFVLLVVAALGGYVGDWGWTGFRGNTLWDWLHLLVLPVLVAVLPLWLRTQHTRELRWRAVFVVGAALLVVVALGGYLLGWSWTGFRGNTLWDWFDLLPVPFVLPLVMARLAARLEAEEPA